jgi:hypothetical protein
MCRSTSPTGAGSAARHRTHSARTSSVPWAVIWSPWRFAANFQAGAVIVPSGRDAAWTPLGGLRWSGRTLGQPDARSARHEAPGRLGRVAPPPALRRGDGRGVAASKKFGAPAFRPMTPYAIRRKQAVRVGRAGRALLLIRFSPRARARTCRDKARKCCVFPREVRLARGTTVPVRIGAQWGGVTSFGKGGYLFREGGLPLSGTQIGYGPVISATWSVHGVA